MGKYIHGCRIFLRCLVNNLSLAQLDCWYQLVGNPFLFLSYLLSLSLPPLWVLLTIVTALLTRKHGKQMVPHLSSPGFVEVTSAELLRGRNVVPKHIVLLYEGITAPFCTVIIGKLHPQRVR